MTNDGHHHLWKKSGYYGYTGYNPTNPGIFRNRTPKS